MQHGLIRRLSRVNLYQWLTYEGNITQQTALTAKIGVILAAALRQLRRFGAAYRPARCVR